MNWQQFEDSINQLVTKIDVKPDIIIAIVRGGLVPARLLATKLSVSDMYALTVIKQGSTREVVTDITKDISGETVLLVEDALETAKSLLVAKHYLEGLGATVQTAALYIMPNSETTPNYYLDVREPLPKFPWE